MNSSKISKKQYTKYNHQILSYMIPFFQKLLPFGIAGTLLSIILYINNKEWTSPFLYVDSVIMIMLIVFYFSGNKISPKLKIQLTILGVLAIATLSFLRVGYLNNGLYLMLVSLLLSYVFLERRFAVIVASIIMLNYLLVFYKVATGTFVPAEPPEVFIYSVNKWIYQIIGLILVVSVIFVSIRGIKSYLLNNIIMLEDQLKIAEDLAYINTLTGLPNRTGFKKLADYYISQKQKGALILIDIKHFNRINAFYGMEYGDSLLEKIGDFSNKLGKELGAAGYLGANSFAFWVDDIVTEKHFNEHLFNYQGQLNEALDINSPLSVYCVVLPYNKKDKDFDSMFKVGDRLMKQLKQNNNKPYIYFKEATLSALDTYNKTYQIIEKAVINKEFQVFFQEKMNTSQNKVVGLEALARLKTEEGFVPPNIFIPIIEENDLSSDFGWVIIEKVFVQLPEIINRYGNDVTVSINLSPKQLQTTSFFNQLEQYITFYDIKPHTIEFEITENVVIGNLEEAIKVLSRLKALGINISIDDFGTGYSSLQYICDLPIDVLKIDKSFIDQITTSKKTKAIVSSIIQIAKTVDIDIIAEGVEHEEQVAVLNEIGCYIIQGYLYSYPKPLDV